MTPELVATTPTATVTLLQKKVMVCCPWQKSMSPITSFCVGQLLDKRRTSSCLNFGDAFIIHARNTLADLFLESTLDYCLMIDDDMVVPFGNARWFKAYTGWQWMPDAFAAQNALDRLLSHGKTLVGALYFGKYPQGPGIFNEGMAGTPMNTRARSGPHNEIQPTKWVGTGCLLIHRTVFEDIEKRYLTLARGPNGKGGQWFTPHEHNLYDAVVRTCTMLADGAMTAEKAMKAYELLEAAKSDARANSSLGMGEDVAFCKRAAACGHQAYVDLGLICGHIGYTVYGPRNTGESPPLKNL